MKILGIIPSRYASTRFPGKPLALINGKTMIQHVYENAVKSKELDDLVVATDDERIFKTVTDFGGKVLMTSTEHQNGTERCAEVAKSFTKEFDFIINIQGDEPFLDPDQIDEFANFIQKNRNIEIATQIKTITDQKLIRNKNIVKAIPADEYQIKTFFRDPATEYKAPYYKHIGIYAYSLQTLVQIVKLNSTKNEKDLSLEQFRWMDHGLNIHYQITQFDSHGIDHPKDLENLC